MGSIATHVPADLESANRVEPGSFPLIMAQLPESVPSKGVDADKVAIQWVESFNQAITQPEFDLISNVFLPESYWRDQLCLSWDFHTLKGPQNIVALLKSTKGGCRVKSLSLDKSSALRSPILSPLDADGKVDIVRAFLTVETDIGSGTGVVRLAQEQGVWKVFTLFTLLKELKGFEQFVGKKRPFGVHHGEHISRNNWLDRRNIEENFEDGQEPTVLILGKSMPPSLPLAQPHSLIRPPKGAGQAGLTIAARLKMLGIKSLIVDREDRIGDNWRSRYHQLVLHDPVWYDHLPYLPFPESWPVFTPKDKLGDWFESYARLMELNVWIRTSISKSSWDGVTGKWTVSLERLVGGKTEMREFHPKVSCSWRKIKVTLVLMMVPIAYYSVRIIYRYVIVSFCSSQILQTSVQICCERQWRPDEVIFQPGKRAICGQANLRPDRERRFLVTGIETSLDGKMDHLK